MLDAAKPFVDQAAGLAGPAGLLEGGGTYVSVYMRLRQSAAVFDRLLAASIQAQAAIGNRNSAPILNALSARMKDMGDIVAQDFTPEEKAAFAAFLEQKKTTTPRVDVDLVLLPLAEHAGLEEIAVRWRTELLEADRQNSSSGHLSRLVELQTERFHFAELAQELERLADLGGPLAGRARIEAAQAYRKAGDPAGELRILSRVPVVSLPASLLTRNFELLLERDPQRLISLAGAPTGALARAGAGRPAPAIRDAAANFVVGRGTADQALAAVRARGQGLPPVWTDAYTALVGFHFARFETATTGAFTAALGAATIGERLKPVDRSVLLAGDTWFAYGSRFGEYLTFAKQPGADDYLASEIERTPARSDAYVSLADFFRDEGTPAQALAGYDHAATLNPRRSDVHLRAAPILWSQGQRTAATERWRRALQLLAAQAAGRGSFETAPLIAAFDAIGSRKLLPGLREPADKAVRAYVTRNGTYRADPLFRAVFRAPGDAASGTDWLIDLGRVAPNQVAMLAAVANASWLPDLQRDRVYDRIVAVSEESVAQAHGAAQSAAQAQLDRWRIQRIRSLIDTKQVVRADGLLRGLPEEMRLRYGGDVTGFETRIAAADRALETLLDRYARDESRPVNLDALRNAATLLRRSGDAVSARRIMEFVYTRQLEDAELAPPTLLGLAEIRLQQGNVPAALELLRRLVRVVGEPFDNLAASGALLERLDHPVEALEFRRARVQAVPWDPAAQIALARSEVAAGQDRAEALDRLRRIADSPAQRYAVRVEASRAFASSGGRLGRQPRSELDWLRAPADMTPSTADQPMFVAARVSAAERAAEPSTRVNLLLAAVATAPGDASLRVPLVRAELGARKPADAIEALQPVLSRNRSLTDLGLTSADRSRLASELGDACLQLDRLSDAVRFFTIALEGQGAAARAPLRRSIATINEEISRRARNAARQPHIGEALDQPQLVRPRIPPPRVLAAAAVAVPGGPR
jgi:tetratricopeptide (TPR) repeat protein